MNQWSDDNLDDDGPQECDLDQFGDDDESETVPCPACGAEIYEDSPQCPECGQYVFGASGASYALRWWLVLGAAAALAGFVFYILH